MNLNMFSQAKTVGAGPCASLFFCLIVKFVLLNKKNST